VHSTNRTSAAFALLDLLEYVCGDIEDALRRLLTGCTLARLGIVPAQAHTKSARQQRTDISNV
jgi:hypothetical protein